MAVPTTGSLRLRHRRECPTARCQPVRPEFCVVAGSAKCLQPSTHAVLTRLPASRRHCDSPARAGRSAKAVVPRPADRRSDLGESASRRRAEDDEDARALSQKARVPTVVNASLPADVSLPLEASVRRGWRESSKRSSASVGADAPFRGKGIAGSRPSGRSLFGNAIVARVARLGAGAPLSLGESARRPG
jgi:hypothetical protein